MLRFAWKNSSVEPVTLKSFQQILQNSNRFLDVSYVQVLVLRPQLFDWFTMFHSRVSILIFMVQAEDFVLQCISS